MSKHGKQQPRIVVDGLEEAEILRKAIANLQGQALVRGAIITQLFNELSESQRIGVAQALVRYFPEAFLRGGVQ